MTLRATSTFSSSYELHSSNLDLFQIIFKKKEKERKEKKIAE